MIRGHARTIKVAAIQLRCDPGEASRNLDRAGALVAEAAALGAGIVLLPELTPGGYVLTQELWNTAESMQGASVGWLKSTAQRLGIYLGMSFLEAEGQDFYNSFVLATPQGTVAGRVRKNPPASAEAYFFRAGSDAHVIDTELGRLGVGICYEALLHERMAEHHRDGVDMVLCPMSAGTPAPVFPIRKRDAAAFDGMLQRLAAHHARMLGVPVVTANKCGPLVTAMPAGMPTQHTRFPGLSTIADSDGTVKSQLGAEQGIAVAEVTLDPARKVASPPQGHGRWALPVPWFSFLFPLAALLGRRAYDRSRTRAARALSASRGARA
jgi:N-carbamoylputrescine amidase